VPEGVPSELFFDSKFLCPGSDVLAQDRLPPVRLAAASAAACENPISRIAVTLMFLPFLQGFDYGGMNWNWFLRRFGFARPHNSAHNRARYVHCCFREIDVRPLQSKQFTLTQAGGGGEQHQGAFSNSETIRQHPDLCRSEDAGRLPAFRPLPNQLNRIAVKEFVPAGVIEQYGHHAANLRTAALCKWQTSSHDSTSMVLTFPNSYFPH